MVIFHSYGTVYQRVCLMGFNREHLGQSTTKMEVLWENHGKIMGIFFAMGNQINMFNSYVK